MRRGSLFLTLLCLFTLGLAAPQAEPLPIRGIHFQAPGHADVEFCCDFIREALPQEGVNTLILEINYGYQYKSHPELASRNGLTEDDLKTILAACKQAKIELIPMINCLGHQSWAKHTFSLLTIYPEFDETPGQYPNNEEIYCRSYCPLHPRVHEVIFSLIDELAEVCEAKAFHVGMDEVFLLGESSCPRCQGKDPADLFAHEVNLLYNHLTKSKRTLWIWGDRFLDGHTTGIGEWEASQNRTASAIDLVPKDIMICDWHYEKAHPTALYFAMKGFPVVSSPWRKEEVALGQLEQIRWAHNNVNETIANRMKGMVHTTWCGMVPFIKAYQEQEVMQENEAATESAQCFKTLFAELRK